MACRRLNTLASHFYISELKPGLRICYIFCEAIKTARASPRPTVD